MCLHIYGIEEIEHGSGQGEYRIIEHPEQVARVLKILAEDDFDLDSSFLFKYCPNCGTELNKPERG